MKFIDSSSINVEFTISLMAYLLLENLRFYPEEEEGEVNFARALSILGDVYINDAFGTAHRNHASTGVLPTFFKGKKGMGLLLSKEVDAIEKVLRNGTPPILSIIGGAKVSSKIQILKNLTNVVDDLIIGGGMAYTFIKANGGEIGNSLCEEAFLDEAQKILSLAKNKNVKVHLPQDVIVSEKISLLFKLKLIDFLAFISPILQANKF